jgi:hypothetical protein
MSNAPEGVSCPPAQRGSSPEPRDLAATAWSGKGARQGIEPDRPDVSSRLGDSPMSTPDKAKTRDDQLKPGAPPRPSTEPARGEGSSRTSKTQTDPATGEPAGAPPSPAPSGRDG